MGDKRYGILREELGYYIHLALRKSCDSKATSLAWNLIGMPVFNDAWGTFLDLVWLKLENDGILESLRYGVNKLPYSDGYHNSLRLSFELFDGDDWEYLCRGIEYFTE